MRNRFGGNCYRCGLWVGPGTGYFEKRRDAAGFRVQHCYTTDWSPAAGKKGITCEGAQATAKKKVAAQ